MVKYKKYTVIGYHADNDEPYMAWVKSTRPQLAAIKVARKASSSIVVVEVIKGFHKGCLLNEMTWPDGIKPTP